MPCSITIGNIMGFRFGSSDPHRMEVTGTADGCSKVCLTVENSANGATTTQVSAEVNASGGWIAHVRADDGHYSLGDFTCGPNKKYTVRAHCCDDAACVAPTITFNQMECRPDNAENSCPTISLEAPTIGDCNPDGTRTVVVNATVGLADGADSGVVQWAVDGDSGDTAVVDAGTQSITLTSQLPGDGNQHTIGLGVVLPVGCSGSAAEISFTVPNCTAAPGCPQVGAPGVQVANSCNADGTRAVTFTADVTAPDGETAVLQWEHDGDQEEVAVVTGTQTITTSYDYPGDGGTHTVTLTVVSPAGCQGSSATFTVPECAEPSPCPEIETPTATVDDQCNADGTRTVTFTAGLNVPDGVTATVQWMHDGEFGQAEQVTGSQAITTTHDYPGDGQEHEAELTVVAPSGCAGASVTFRVAECPIEPVCPTVSFADIDVASACDENDQKHIKVTAEVAPGSSGSVAAELELLQAGNVVASLDTGSSTGSTLTLSGDADVDPADDFSARVTINSPQGCPGASTEVEVPACDSVTPPPPQETNLDICSILRFLIILGVGLAAIGLVLLLCPLIAAPLIPSVPTVMIIGGVLLGLGVLIAVIAVVAWFFICQPTECGWMLLLWQVLFIAGVLLTFAAFCPACMWFALGLIVLGAALAAFATWILRCRPTTCSIYAELLLVMIVFDITAVLEMVLGSCVIVSNPIAATLWALGVAAFNIIVYAGLRRNNCLNTN